jgi:hypothetical protein
VEIPLDLGTESAGLLHAASISEVRHLKVADNGENLGRQARSVRSNSVPSAQMSSASTAVQAGASAEIDG